MRTADQQPRRPAATASSTTAPREPTDSSAEHASSSRREPMTSTNANLDATTTPRHKTRHNAVTCTDTTPIPLAGLAAGTEGEGSPWSSDQMSSSASTIRPVFLLVGTI